MAEKRRGEGKQKGPGPKYLGPEPPLHKGRKAAAMRARVRLQWTILVVAAGEIRALVSDAALSRHASGHMTLDDVIAALRRLVLVAECDVFAYLSVENQLVAVISAVTDAPTPLQVSDHHYY